MAAENSKRKAFLFVDDDVGFLTNIQDLFSEMAHGRWDIFTAENHAQALALLAKLRVDVVVLDIGMPGMDGIQFLHLLGRTHPGQQVAMLTGGATEETTQDLPGERCGAVPRKAGVAGRICRPSSPRWMRWRGRSRKGASGA